MQNETGLEYIGTRRQQKRWGAVAQFIWGPDLKRDNTLFCRVTVRLFA